MLWANNSTQIRVATHSVIEELYMDANAESRIDLAQELFLAEQYDAALPILKELIENDSNKALMDYIGLAYEHSPTEPNSIKEAKYWYKESIAHTNSDYANLALARITLICYKDTEELEDTIKNLFANQTKANEMGSAFALGCIYSQESGIKNYALAKQYFKKAKNLGHLSAGIAMYSIELMEGNIIILFKLLYLRVLRMFLKNNRKNDIILNIAYDNSKACEKFKESC